MSLEDEIEQAKKELGERIYEKIEPPKPLPEAERPKPPSTNVAMLFFQWFTGKRK